jgi:polyphosphate glucokinase
MDAKLSFHPGSGKSQFAELVSRLQMKKKPTSKNAKTVATDAAQSAATTLAIDIGGTGLKACVLDGDGEMISERVRVATPANCAPKRMVDLLAELVAPFGSYDRVSVGFPGVVRRGRIVTAHNLGEKAWKGFNLDLALTKKLHKPVRVLNDADIQGLGAIRAKGVELVITLGTGLGSSLFEDGRLCAHLELAHHPFHKGKTYEEELGKVALKKVGKRKWNRRVGRAIETLRQLTTFDHLYLGGGNAAAVKIELPRDVTVVSNDLGMRGGIWLWRERGHGSTDIFRKADAHELPSDAIQP